MIGAHELNERLAVLATRPGEYTAFVAQRAFRGIGRLTRRRVPGRRIGMPARMETRISGAPSGGFMRMAMEFAAGQKAEQHGQKTE
ncbi:MAG: hypothetical protein LBI59_01815 [Candidatus Accumulibacter sp.]|nr:hypothetical protein [Accumulibacter sp.]